MRVALNAQLLSTAASFRTAGINRVIHELLVHLRGVPTELDFIVFAPYSRENQRMLSTARLPRRLTRLPTSRPLARIAWEQTVLPGALAAEQVDLLHALAFASPLAWRGKTVLTVYDLSFFHFPETFNLANRTYLRLLTPHSVRRADRVIAISEHTRQDVIRMCGVAPQQVTAIPLAADVRFQPATAERVARFREERGLANPFILYLGTLEPRKNVENLLRAYARLQAAGELEHELVIAGSLGWRYKSIFELVQKLGVERAVRFPGFVPAAEQPLWYSAADIFAFPSLYEGFGLPPLEAMACGTPVLTSNISSLPEVVGNAGVLVDPKDVAALSTALGELAADPARRSKLSDAGLKRAATFSWERMARETVRVYHEVLSIR